MVRRINMEGKLLDLGLDMAAVGVVLDRPPAGHAPSRLGSLGASPVSPRPRRITNRACPWPRERPRCESGSPTDQNVAVQRGENDSTTEDDRSPMKRVAVVMGSASDAPVMEGAIEALRDLGVPVEVRVLSAHRTPDDALQFAA